MANQVLKPFCDSLLMKLAEIFSQTLLMQFWDESLNAKKLDFNQQQKVSSKMVCIDTLEKPYPNTTRFLSKI